MQIAKVLQGILERRFRKWGRRAHGAAYQNSVHHCCGTSHRFGADGFSGGHFYESNELSQRRSKFRLLKLISNQKGEGELLAVLIVFIVMVFLLMQPIDTHIMQNKYVAAKMILNRYMNTMRLQGYLTATDEASMVQDFNNIGCPIANPSTDITANAKESQGDARILRNPDPSASKLSLTVTCTPSPEPFKMMSLIGGSHTTTQIKVGREDQSERVSP